LTALLALSCLLAQGCQEATSSDSDDDGAGDTDIDTNSDSDSDSQTDSDTGSGTDTSTGSLQIPETCAQAEQAATTVGCLFYAVDLDNGVNGDPNQYAVVVSNVHQTEPATVSSYKGNGVGWDAPTTVQVPPMDLHVFNLPDYHVENSGLWPKASFKIESDIPIIAYQFNPLDGADSWMSDASLLFPVPALSRTYDVIGWEHTNPFYQSYFTVVAVTDGTQVTVTPSVPPQAGGVVPASTAPFMVDMEDGDVLQVCTNEQGANFTGSRVESNENHPIAVFVGDECAFIPLGVLACDHLEEQVPGARFWGTRFVAARVPVRSTDPVAVDQVLWQLYAFEDNTQVTLTAAPEVTGLPFTESTMAQGELVQFMAGGTQTVPGDFYIEADKPIAVMQYMIGCSNPYADDAGDPAMIYVNPVEQFLPRYVVLVPTTWEGDALVITRDTGVGVLLDGVAIPEADFNEVFGTNHEVARVSVADGVHTVQSVNSSHPVGVIVIGWDYADSYAYTGGMGMLAINPEID
jgi:hypothetical protein